MIRLGYGDRATWPRLAAEDDPQMASDSCPHCGDTGYYQGSLYLDCIYCDAAELIADAEREAA